MLDRNSWPLLLAALLGCFYLIIGTDEPVPVPTSPAVPASTSGSQDFSERAAVAELKVLHIGERSWENHPAIAVVFSAAMNDSRDLGNYFELRDESNSILAFEPVLDDERRTVFFPEVQAEHSYTLTVSPGLQSIDRLRLQTTVSKSIKIRKVTPAFGFASSGMLLPADLSAGLPIMSVNIPEIDVQILRVHDDKLGDFLTQYYGTHRNNRYRRLSIDSDWGLNQLQGLSDSVFMARFKTGAPPDTRTISHLPINKHPELTRSGLYIAVLKKPGEFYGNLRSSLFYVSDIGLHTRAYANSLHIYANTISTAQPMEAVEILLLNNTGAIQQAGHTNAQGLARFGLDSVQTIVARKGDQISVLSLNGAELDLSSFAVSGPPHKSMELFLYSNRDLFRPGESVNVVGLLRDHDGHLSVQLPLHASLIRPDGKPARNWILHPGGGGNYEVTLKLPSDAPTGQWQLLVRTTPEAENQIGKLEFHVEEFLPERMKLVLSSERNSLKPGELLEVKLTGSYLHGAKASGNTVRATVNISANPRPFAEFSDFAFADMQAPVEHREELEPLTLNHDGIAQLQYQPTGISGPQAQSIRVVASLLESGGRPVVRELRRTLWSTPALIGIRPTWSGQYAPANGTAGFEVIRLGTDGARLSASNLSVSVIREHRDYFWEWSTQRGWHASYTADEYPVYNQSLNFSADELGSFELPVKHGAYRIEVFDSETGNSMSYHFKAGWSYRSDETGLASKPDKIPLRLNKLNYQNGDTATLTASLPDDAELLLFVESDKVLWSKRLSAKAGDVSVQIPVDKDWDRHDIYISALALRPGRQADGFSPKRALGVTHLPLNRDHRKLTVAIEAPTHTIPETILRTKIRVRSKGDNSGLIRLTLAAVDVGALAITSYRTPDPLKHFFGRRRFSPATHDLYAKVIEQFDGMQASMSYGGDAALGRRRLGESRVEILSLFSGIVTVDAEGYAEIPLNLPDFNGRLRLMAIAFDSNRYGSAETEITVAAPLVAEIAAPRFLAPGDESRLTIDLHNTTQRTLAFRLNLTASSPLRVRYEAQDYRMDPGEHIVVQTPVFADFQPGVGSIKLKSTGDVQLNRKHELSVRPAWPETSRKYFATLAPGEKFNIPDNSVENLVEQSVHSRILVSANPPVDIATAVNGLLVYPYGCLEQTTSRAFPYLLVDEAIARKFQLPEFDRAERSERIRQALERLTSLQKTSGGFALWNGDGAEKLWLSAYVTDFLVSATDAGFSVPPEMLTSALGRLQQLLAGSIETNDPFTRDIRHNRFSARAYAAYVLARRNQASLGSLRSLYEREGKHTLSGLALVQLGIALHLAGDPQLSETVIVEGLNVGTSPSQWLGDYGSAIRDTALAYALLQQHDIQPARSGKLLYFLRGHLRDRHWLSTQERTAVLRAGLQFTGKPGEHWMANLNAGEAVRSLKSNQDQSMEFTAHSISKGITLSNTGAIPLFIQADVSGYTQVAQKLSHPALELERRWLDMNGSPVNRDALKQGQLILVEIQVHARRNLRDALVVDLVPAGLEVENLNIGVSEGLPDIRLNGINPKTAMDDPAIVHKEYRDDRFVAALSMYRNSSKTLFYLARVVSPGKFSVPPSFAEDMYRPQIRTLGNSAEDIHIK